MEHLKLQTLQPKITLSSHGRLLVLDKPVVMGILNLTPDSFYDGGKHQKEVDALKKTEELLKDGATIIDIGAYSSRPGATHISAEEEMQRLLPIVIAIHARFPNAWLSIDTFRSTIARAAIDAGAHMINDISSGDDDPNMMQTVAELKVPYAMMHKQGTPQTMQQHPTYENVTLDILQYFTEKINHARALGIVDLCIDPGFGFGKTLDHNYTLLRNLGDFAIFELPIIAGISRKKMVQVVTGTQSQTALNATTAAHTIALLNGAHILRAHDVKEAVECINIVNATYGTIRTV
ncbi:MAG: dihydropteroate synthase [Bacteroidia bacterium]|jgi:dihydropteroate synthase|nr:dihydropteroate synthase [Bacteroidia bacterium]